MAPTPRRGPQPVRISKAGGWRRPNAPGLLARKWRARRAEESWKEDGLVAVQGGRKRQFVLKARRGNPAARGGPL